MTGTPGGIFALAFTSPTIGKCAYAGGGALIGTGGGGPRGGVCCPVRPVGRGAPLALPGSAASWRCGGLFDGRGLVDGRVVLPGPGLDGLGGGLAFAAAGLRRTSSSSNIHASSYGDVIVERGEEGGRLENAAASSSEKGIARAQADGARPTDEVNLSLVVLL